MKNLSKYYPHLLSLAGFVVIALLYFYPVLQGKEIFQSDIVQYTGMAKEQNDFRAETGEEPYWTNSAFGGMPTYQLGAKYPHNYIKMLDSALRFLPRPADYLFLYFAGFYILMLVLRAGPLKAFFGALAFGLSTYMIIILGVGHNAKAHAIAYMPMVLAGVILVFKKRYVMGGLLTMVAAALEIQANHFQMTYYLVLLLLVFAVYFSIQIIRRKEFRHLAWSTGIFVLAAFLALGANATNLLATAEYAKHSTRGKTGLTYLPDGSPRSNDDALSREYITEYSYGIAESFNLVAPRLFGGSNSENLGKDSQVYELILGMGVPEHQAREFASALPLYWGDQPIVAAPAYIGAVVFFLAMLGLFFGTRRIRFALLAGALLSLVLSWGKNMGLVTDFFIDYVPLYSSFRAVSSIQVILELCMPALAIMGIDVFFRMEPSVRWEALWKTAAGTLGLLLLLLVFKGSFSFTGGSDDYFQQNYGPEFVQALIADRKALYSADLLRSGFLISASFAALLAFHKGRISQLTALIIVGLLMVSDLFFIDRNYVNSKSFVSSAQVREPFSPTAADHEILKDPAHYRVFEVSGNISSARASYFHKSLGGYHAAKPRRFQELFDYQIARNNLEAYNMLNVRYVIQKDEQGNDVVLPNPDANGNAWFVSELKTVTSDDTEMKALDKFNSRKTAFVNSSEFPQAKAGVFDLDSLARISLTSYEPNLLTYKSRNASPGFAVFSEAYYGNGWQAYLDGKPVPHFRVNYLLRGMPLPAGEHVIEFKFEPDVIQTGGTISMLSSLLMVLLAAGAIYLSRR